MAEVRSTIVCPACGHRESEIMPEDACQYFYKCEGCGVVMKPKKGDCCVFWHVDQWVHGLSSEISPPPMGRRFCFLYSLSPKRIAAEMRCVDKQNL